MDEFYDMSPKEYYHAMKGYWDREVRHMRQSYEVMRMHAVLTINPHLPRGKQIGDPRKLIRFTWEGVKVQTMEEMKAMLMAMAVPKKKDG